VLPTDDRVRAIIISGRRAFSDVLESDRSRGIELLDRGRTGLQYTKVVVPRDSLEQAIRIKKTFFSPDSRPI
jgi:hypothetical protein